MINAPDSLPIYDLEGLCVSSGKMKSHFHLHARRESLPSRVSDGWTSLGTYYVVYAFQTASPSFVEYRQMSSTDSQVYSPRNRLQIVHRCLNQYFLLPRWFSRPSRSDCNNAQ